MTSSHHPKEIFKEIRKLFQHTIFVIKSYIVKLLFFFVFSEMKNLKKTEYSGKKKQLLFKTVFFFKYFLSHCRNRYMTL